MKKVSVLLCLVIVLSLFTTGCSGNTERTDLAICGSYAVPGMITYDLKGTSFDCSVIEEDSQGRILFTYSAPSIITGSTEQALIICQKRDNDAVYYYEDVCYLLNQWTTEDVELLKAANDWDRPLDYSKTTSRSNKVTMDGYLVCKGELDHTELKQACCAEFGIDQECIIELCILDKCGNQKELYWMRFNESSEEVCYFLLVDINYSITSLQAERRLDSLAELALWRAENM